MLQLLTHPVTGRTVKLGRRRDPDWKPRLKLADYLDFSTLPTAPAVISYTGDASTTKFLENVLANDTLGDCTCAGALHIMGEWLGDNNVPIPYTAETAIALYEAACGYNPKDPSTDQGGSEPAVLAFLRDKGLPPNGSHKIAGSVFVNAASMSVSRAGLWLMGGLYLGLGLPDEWINPFPSKNGYVWDVTPTGSNPENGHCIVALGYNALGLVIDSWGLIGTLTWAAYAAYCTQQGGGESHVMLSTDWISKASQKAPNGLNYASLQADLPELAA